MRARRYLWLLLASLAGMVILVVVSVGSVWLYLHPRVDRLDGVVYRQRQGRNLALDVLRTGKPNGFGVIIMVSGGWKSARPGSFQPWMPRRC
jgi:hypothetical protein